mmetsp:Transcript_32110/g.103641  ORF Transcript_32110/g.103641 Transcript_32110/m.103641 type:complete len:268 (+) Transcript_32110:2767-3570(+)
MPCAESDGAIPKKFVLRNRSSAADQWLGVLPSAEGDSAGADAHVPAASANDLVGAGAAGPLPFRTNMFAAGGSNPSAMANLPEPERELPRASGLTLAARWEPLEVGAPAVLPPGLLVPREVPPGELRLRAEFPVCRAEGETDACGGRGEAPRENSRESSRDVSEREVPLPERSSCALRRATARRILSTSWLVDEARSTSAAKPPAECAPSLPFRCMEPGTPGFGGAVEFVRASAVRRDAARRASCAAAARFAAAAAAASAAKASPAA